MNPGQKVFIQLVSEKGEPVVPDNVLVDIDLYTVGNFRYKFIIGRTDQAGQLNFTYSDVEKLRLDNAHYFLMDYNTRLEECDPTIRISVPSEHELKARNENAVRSFHKSPEWAAHWPSNGKIVTQAKSVKLAAETTRVELVCVLGG
jgi:hypothetical protein